MPQEQNCTIRCKTAESPKDECRCSCNGHNHGSLSRIDEFGTVDIDDNDPFETVVITEDNVEVKREVETVADVDEYSLEDLSVGDKIDMYVEYASHGWKIHRKVEIDSIVDDTVYAKKSDGFVVGATADTIPIEQRVFRDKRPDIRTI